MDRPLQVLVVGGPEEVTRIAASLDQDSDDLAALTATSIETARGRLSDADVDCVVTGNDLPDGDGVAFLETVRETRADLPFVLSVDNASEAVASEAFDASCTDYLARHDGTDQSTLLRQRIRDVVDRSPYPVASRAPGEWLTTLLEHASDFALVVDETGVISYATPSVEQVLGYDPDSVVGTDAFSICHPDDEEQATEVFQETLSGSQSVVDTELRALNADGHVRWLDVRARNLLDDPTVAGVIVNVRDITDRKRHEQELERQNDRLTAVANVISHDLRNPLAVAVGNLELVREERDAAELAAVEMALERMDELIDSVLAMTRLGRTVTETEPFWLSTLAEECWAVVQTPTAGLDLESDRVIDGHRERLKQVLENLFRNAVEHGRDDVRVRVGALSNGFYVEDDGPGISPDQRDRVFEPGYSTATEGTGLGLNIVAEIVEAHGWTIAATEGVDGGARFEITGMDSAI